MALLCGSRAFQAPKFSAASQTLPVRAKALCQCLALENHGVHRAGLNNRRLNLQSRRFVRQARQQVFCALKGYVPSAPGHWRCSPMRLFAQGCNLCGILCERYHETSGELHLCPPAGMLEAVKATGLNPSKCVPAVQKRNRL